MSDTSKFSTLAGMRRNLVKQSTIAKRPLFGWRGAAGFFWVADALPHGWENPYWTTREVPGERGKPPVWAIVPVYGKGADAPDAPVPDLPDPPPFERRIFAGPDAAGSKRRADATTASAE